jgi:hypothetical protein
MGYPGWRRVSLTDESKHPVDFRGAIGMGPEPPGHKKEELAGIVVPASSFTVV